MGRLTLPDSGLIYLDADAVIYSVEKIDPYWSLLEPLWLALQDSNLKVVSSDLLLLETLVKPVQAGDNELADIFRQLLLNTAEVTLQPISRAVLEQAVRLRVTYNLKTPDAIHAATAITTGCHLFLTNDRVFERVPNLPVTILNDLVEA